MKKQHMEKEIIVSNADAISIVNDFSWPLNYAGPCAKNFMYFTSCDSKSNPIRYVLSSSSPFTEGKKQAFK